MVKEWFTTREIAELALPGLPTTRQGFANLAAAWAGQPALCRKRAGVGGGMEYHYTQLPVAAQSALIRKLAPPPVKAKPAPAHVPGNLDVFNRASVKKKKKATERHRILAEIDRREPIFGRLAAIRAVAAEEGVAVSTLYNWMERLGCVDPQNKLAALVPLPNGAPDKVYIDPDAWDTYKALYLDLRRWSHAACYRDLQVSARAKGWKLPSAKTFVRRVQETVPEAVQVLCRDGQDALKRLYPYQERDRSHFHALECVNADGHKWDLMVKWPDGYVGRPMMVAFQDLYSGLFLSWRVDRSENKEAVRLAFGDLVDTYGIPAHCWLDNGRAFASKWLTGSVQNRFRFKVRDEDPVGILPLLGTKVHWTKPYSGQSKPIERAFGEFASNYAKHPFFAGAGTGNSPMNKPEDYGSKTIPIDVFLDVVNACIHEHNNREGRNNRVCGGKLSFQQAFNASYTHPSTIIPKADASHRQLWLLAAEGVKARAEDGSVWIMKNRYWAPEMVAHRGKPVVVRFDPQKLIEGVHVYGMDGAIICQAEVQGVAAFDDATAARAHASALKAYLRGVTAQRDALVRLTAMQAAAPLDRDVPDLPEAKVIRMVSPSGAVRVAAAKPSTYDAVDVDDAFQRAVAMQRRDRLRIVDDETAEAWGASAGD